MPTMGKYCKAYLSSQFEKFPEWRPALAPSGTAQEDNAEEAYFFLQENLVVTDGIFLDERIVFDQVTPQWERFCREELQFESPSFDAPQQPIETAVAE